MSDGIDYGRFDAGRHVNYWTLDRTIQRELGRVNDHDAFAWAEPRLSDFGDVVSGSASGSSTISTPRSLGTVEILGCG